MSRLFPPLVFVAVMLAVPAATDAQTVNRCIGADGGSVYSDQPCHFQGARERHAPQRPDAPNASGFARGTGTMAHGCARSLGGLMVGVRGALESRDVNRLATHYHWSGTSSRGGRQLMNELEAIARRPLMDIAFLYPEAAPAMPDDFGFGPSPATMVSTSAELPANEPQAMDYPLQSTDGTAAPRPRRPHALRIEQASGPTDAGSRRTDFTLRRHAGCWWIEL